MPLLPILAIAFLLGWVVLGALTREDSIVDSILTTIVLVVAIVMGGAVMLAQSGIWSRDSAFGALVEGLARTSEAVLERIFGLLEGLIPGGAR